MDLPLPDFTRQLLKLFSIYDCHSELWWTDVAGQLTFFINCNDMFHWATADLEEITVENFHVLEESLEAAGYWGPELFCARVRAMRPQGAFYEKVIPKEVWPLFDACGPEREIDRAPFGNPVGQP